MENHECRYEEKILDMFGLIKESSTDIKWLKHQMEIRNGVLEEHMTDSDKYRRAIDRNTVWRHVFKFMGLGLFVTLGIVLRYLLYAK
ncbi:MAG: hypothetical protein CMI54_06080 [Parcubacteria group bacterium]|nr:hypothetical protein [Parcubacteria group bacterium]